MPPETSPRIPSPAVTDREDVRRDVDEALRDHLATLGAELAAIDAAAAPVLDEATHLVAGGKRLRAAFAYWSWRAHGGDPTSSDRDAVIGVGAALELFQAAALVHDDVMDNSDTRRGRPAAHRAFAALHQDAGWQGSSTAFGDNAAILLGDVLLIACGSRFAHATASLAPTARRDARQIYDLMQTEVTIGQFLDVRAQVLPWGEDPVVDEARARGVVRAKSARYSVEHPITLGAALAGAGPESVATARTFGLPLGEAFQLRDDLLGVFGDPAVTGKPAGDDLREGKRTVLVCRALQSATAAEREVVLGRLGDPDLTDGDVDRLREILTGTGAARGVEELIDQLTDEGFSALSRAGLAEPGAAVLAELGHAATRRLS